MLVRPPADHRVDGSDVEAPRGVELTDPKRPRGLPHAPRPAKRGWARDCWCSRPLCCSGHTDRKPRPRGAPPSGVRDRAGGHGGRETPGPIPNPEVKPSSADGTARGSVWESRRPPDHAPSPAGTRNPRQGAPKPCGGQPFNNHTSTRHPTRQPGPPDNRAADRQDPHPRPNHRQHHPTRPRTSHPNTTRQHHQPPTKPTKPTGRTAPIRSFTCALHLTRQ